MDGNNSDKHLDGAGSTDKRAFEYNYLINPSDVDVFADALHALEGVLRLQALRYITHRLRMTHPYPMNQYHAQRTAG
jgi:hypothetical protein